MISEIHFGSKRYVFKVSEPTGISQYRSLYIRNVWCFDMKFLRWIRDTFWILEIRFGSRISDFLPNKQNFIHFGMLGSFTKRYQETRYLADLLDVWC